MTTYRDLTPEEARALADFADKHGKARWRTKLREQWMAASADPVLQALRNSHGPNWLEGFRLGENGRMVRRRA